MCVSICENRAWKVSSLPKFCSTKNSLNHQHKARGFRPPGFMPSMLLADRMTMFFDTG
jgi:hypothetical protein